MAGPEKKIRDRVVEWARTTYKGSLIVRKQAMVFGRGRSGYPDDEFNAIHKHTWFIEFKAPGKVLTDLQIEKKRELEALGYSVYLCDDVVQGKRIVAAEMVCARTGKHVKHPMPGPGVL